MIDPESFLGQPGITKDPFGGNRESKDKFGCTLGGFGLIGVFGVLAVFGVLRVLGVIGVLRAFGVIIQQLIDVGKTQLSSFVLNFSTPARRRTPFLHVWACKNTIGLAAPTDQHKIFEKRDIHKQIVLCITNYEFQQRDRWKTSG